MFQGGSSGNFFSVGFVLLKRPGDASGAATVAIENLRTAWSGRFAEQTRGAGAINEVQPTLSLVVDSPAAGSTITGPDVTVSGVVLNSTGAETGATVNGIPAAISGNRFVVNHVPLLPGDNSLAISAADVNGLAAATTRTVTATSGYYLRIVPNVDSGTAPLNITFQLRGSFPIAVPTFATSGPVQVALTSDDATTFSAVISCEGTYTVTASATGPDGQQYSDSVTFTVVSANQLQTLLQAKWDALKAGLQANDVNKVVSYLPTYLQTDYLDTLNSLGSAVAVLADYMTPIEFVGIVGGRAKFLNYRTEQLQGQPVLLAFPIYFIQENGIWKLSKF